MAKSFDKQMVDFLRFQLADRHCFAPFTGQDYSAWHAFIFAVELYGRGDYGGQRGAIDAMRALVLSAQQKDDVLACFKKVIPGVLDWGFEPQIWMKIAPRVHPSTHLTTMVHNNENILWPYPDGARVCSHIHSKPSKKYPDYFKCKSCGAEWRLAPEEEKASP